MDRPRRALQEDLITLLCHSVEHGQLVANAVTAELFEGDYRVIAERALDYWRIEKAPPGAHTQNIIADILEDKTDRRAPQFRTMLMNMAELEKGINTAYVIRQLKLFKRMQELKGAILAAAERLTHEDAPSVTETEELLGKILRSGDATFEPGVRLDSYDQFVRWREEQGSQEFDTGIKALDREGIVPERGSIMLLIGATNKGKSWWLVHLGKRALHHRKKVLHITLEMRDLAVMERYYQSVFKVPTHETGRLMQTTLDFNVEGGGELVGFGSRELATEFALSSEDLRLELGTRVEHYGSRMSNCVIKQFPRGSLTVNGLRAYLEQLETVHRFVPDLLLLDYPAIMKQDPKNLRITMGQTYVDLAGLLVEKNMAGAFVHQFSRMGAEAYQTKTAKFGGGGKLTQVAEDWSVVQTADNVILYAQTPGEEQMGLARLVVDKARSRAGHFVVLLTQNYRIGQFVLESSRLPNTYYDLINEMRAMDDKEEATTDDEQDERGND